MNKNEYSWYVQGCYTQEEIINRICEITKSIWEEVLGLSASISNTKDRMYVGDYTLPPAFQCLEIDFNYINVYNSYIINPREILDLDLFEKKFRFRVINEVIRDYDYDYTKEDYYEWIWLSCSWRL